MIDQTNRIWVEIESHKYEFDRQSKALSMMNDISLSELIDHFDLVFFS